MYFCGCPAQRSDRVVSLQLTPGQDPPQSPPELSQTEENSFSQPAVPTSPSQQGNTEHTHTHTTHPSNDLTQAGGRSPSETRSWQRVVPFVTFTSEGKYLHFCYNIIAPLEK